MVADWAAWVEWSNAGDPLAAPLPAPFEARLNQFQKMLVLKVFCEEKLLGAMTSFVQANLGRRFVEFPPIQMEELYTATNKFTPLIFVLSSGADPTNMLVRFAQSQSAQSPTVVAKLRRARSANLGNTFSALSVAS